MKKISSLKAQKGVGLIEVLVSMLILSVCLLGMAALQTVALRNGQSAQSRSMAGIMSNSITDAMRANVTEARNGAYNGSTVLSSAEGATIAGYGLVGQDAGDHLVLVGCQINFGRRQMCVPQHLFDLHQGQVRVVGHPPRCTVT